jgi:hypothetical protein
MRRCFWSGRAARQMEIRRQNAISQTPYHRDGCNKRSLKLARSLRMYSRCASAATARSWVPYTFPPDPIGGTEIYSDGSSASVRWVLMGSYLGAAASNWHHFSCERCLISESTPMLATMTLSGPRMKYNGCLHRGCRIELLPRA